MQAQHEKHLLDSLLVEDNSKFRKEVQQHLAKTEATVEIIMLDSGDYFNYALLYMGYRTVNRPLLIHITNDSLTQKQIYQYYVDCIYGKKKDTETYKRIWLPIDKILQKHKIEKIYLVSDGIYHRINLQMLYNPHDAKHMIDAYELVNVSDLSVLLQR